MKYALLNAIKNLKNEKEILDLIDVKLNAHYKYLSKQVVNLQEFNDSYYSLIRLLHTNPYEPIEIPMSLYSLMKDIENSVVSRFVVGYSKDYTEGFTKL